MLHDTLEYDTIRYEKVIFNVRPKAAESQKNIPHEGK